MKGISLTEKDKEILAVVALLTVLPLTLVMLIASITSFDITLPYVLMVIGWFFGATMTWAYGKYKNG